MMWIRTMRTIVLAWLLADQSIVTAQVIVPVPQIGQPGPVVIASESLRPAIAVRGEPLGVLLIEIPIPPERQMSHPRVIVDDSQGRILYPASAVREVQLTSQREPIRPLGRGALVDRLRNAIRGGAERRTVPVAITVAALFRGNDPVDLHLVGDIDQRIRIPTTPSSQRLHRETLANWWETYTHAAKQTVEDGDHPMLVQKYLTDMLARRFHLPPVDIDPPQDDKEEPLVEPLSTLALLSAIEPLRDKILDEVLVGPNPQSPADQPLPPPPQWTSNEIPVVLPDVPIETIARRVPPECFYMRFGSFANYLWFRDVSSQHGGDLAQMLLMRGFNYETSRRMERMLNTKTTLLAKLFGDKIISDMAVIGRDLYMKEGAGLAVLLSSHNAGLLVSSLESERQQTTKQVPGAKHQTVSIAGKKVSLLSTPDNRIRSFFVHDGNYVLISTSRTIVERFFEVAQSGLSLGSSTAFRAARAWMPDANQYSVFAYLSPEFFHGLVAPQYQIELRRRLEAIAQLELAHVAAQAGRAEGIQSLDIESLKRSGLLPSWFDERSDGARCLVNGDAFIDSRRGARGSFLPIADTEVDHVTLPELQRYAELSEFYQNQWEQMDPMMFGLRRYRSQDNPNNERIALEAYVAPIASDKYGWLANMLAPPSPVEIRLPEDDMISVQAHMRGAIAVRTADYHLFAGVKDLNPPAPGDAKGLVKTLRFLKAAPAYLGAWPMPGFLDSLPLGLGGGRPGADGFAKLLLGLWRWQGGGFSVLSFDRSIIEHAISSLQSVATTDEAQVRARVGDLRGSQLAGWINTQWYRRAWQASQGNARLLDSIHQQLKVPSDQALAVAERLLDVRLQCALQGEYRFTPSPASPGVGWWTSTAWPNALATSDGNVEPPVNYTAPWLNWFHGGRVHLTQWPQQLAIVGTFDVQFPDVADKSEPQLPPMNFDLFQLPLKLFGGEQQQSKPTKRKSF